MSKYVIACILSGVTACFTLWSSWVPDKRKSYILQMSQCLVYAVASIFYGVYSSTATMILCACRNYLASKEKFTTRRCIIFCILVAGVGLACNNAGALGLLPLIATLQYSICCLYFKKLLATKWNIAINLAIWAVYDLMILDFISCAIDTTSFAVTIAAIIRIKKYNLDQK